MRDCIAISEVTMTKLFEVLLGLAFLIAAIDFVHDPKGALASVQGVVNSPSPRMVNGHLVVSRSGLQK